MSCSLPLLSYRAPPAHHAARLSFVDDQAHPVDSASRSCVSAFSHRHAHLLIRHEWRREILLKAGANVVAMSRSEPAELAALVSKYDNVSVMKGDVAKDADNKAVVDFTMQMYQRIDALIRPSLTRSLPLTAGNV